jgi:hypothetical protein
MRPKGTRNHPVKDTVSGALDNGRSEVESLYEEIDEWGSNLESNNMEHLPKYEEVTEARDQLCNANDGLQGIEVPEHLSDLEANYTQDTRRSAYSRSGRMSNALEALGAARDAAQAWLDDNDALEPDEQPEEGEETGPTQEEADERDAQRDATEEFINELENAIGEAENVGFPGMY